jgi:hypothetical protein
MATPVKWVEKDFILRALYFDAIPVICFKERAEYTLMLEKPAGRELVFRPDQPISKLKVGNRLNLMVDFRGQILSFTVRVTGVKDGLIKKGIVVCAAPGVLYRNLNRLYSRIAIPSEMEVRIAFLENRFNLFPRLTTAMPDAAEAEAFSPDTDYRNLPAIINQLSEWIKQNASGHKLVNFKDSKPARVEELVLAETGKALFIPSSRENIPEADPDPRGRIITRSMFMRYLESTGLDPDQAEAAREQLFQEKRNSGVVSDAWVPMRYQEYVIGYIHAWSDTNITSTGQAAPPLDHNAIDRLYHFANTIIGSLKTLGYFDKAQMDNAPFEGEVVDISVSGLLFACPLARVSPYLTEDSELKVTFTFPQREFDLSATITRYYQDSDTRYLGCCFKNVPPADARYLFEFIYGKPFADGGVRFLKNKV